MTGRPQGAPSRYQQLRAAVAVLLGIALVVYAVLLVVQHRLPAALLLGALGVLLAAAGVILLDTVRSTDPAPVHPDLPAPLGGRGRLTTIVGVSAGAISLAAAVPEFAGRSVGDGVVLTVGGLLVIALGLGLPRLARTPTAPPDPADRERPALARRRQFGRPRVALGFGIVTALLGAFLLVQQIAVDPATDRTSWFLAPVVILIGVGVALAAVRQLRSSPPG